MNAQRWPVSAIVLAAGLSRRMGQNKLLMGIGGKPMLSRALELVSSLPFSQKILVHSGVCLRELDPPPGFELVLNPEPERGQASSVRLGVSATVGKHYMFFMGDMPFLDEKTVRILVEKIGDGHIIVPVSGGKRKNPVIFPATLRNELLALSGDTGGRALFAAHPDLLKEIPVENDTAFRDIDTFEDYEGYARQ